MQTRAGSSRSRYVEPVSLMRRLIIMKMSLKMPVVLLCAATLAGCTVNAVQPVGAGTSTTAKGSITTTRPRPLPTVATGESLLVVRTFVGGTRHTGPWDVLRNSGLARTKCIAWNLAPGSLGGGSYEVHLLVPSDKASSQRKALSRLNGVVAVTEGALGDFGQVQVNTPNSKRIPC
jgi:predicted small secreted protein